MIEEMAEGFQEGMEEGMQDALESLGNQTRGLSPADIGGNEKRERIMDHMIFNDLVRNSVGITFDTEKMIDSGYVKADTEVRRGYEDTAFEIYNAAYQLDADNTYLESLPFEEYVKIYNPASEFHSYLLRPDASKKSPAWFFHEVFNNDVGGLRLAALESYKRKLEREEDR